VYQSSEKRNDQRGFDFYEKNARPRRYAFLGFFARNVNGAQKVDQKRASESAHFFFRFLRKKNLHATMRFSEFPRGTKTRGRMVMFFHLKFLFGNHQFRGSVLSLHPHTTVHF
jgi:hypothetical protein